MSSPVRSRRPAVTGATAHEVDAHEGTYSQQTGKASRDRFTADKLRWIQQVVTDVDLSPLARVTATVIATKYLNRETGDAWPAIETLAADVGRGRTQVHAALNSLADRGHLQITFTVGGKSQTNRYLPILKPFGNPKGKDEVARVPNPSENRRETLRKSDTKPFGNPKGNPIEEPIEEPRAGLQPAPESSSATSNSTIDENQSYTINRCRTTHRRAPVGAPRAIYDKGDEFKHGPHGLCTVMKVDGLKVTVRDEHGQFHDLYADHSGLIPDWDDIPF